MHIYKLKNCNISNLDPLTKAKNSQSATRRELKDIVTSPRTTMFASHLTITNFTSKSGNKSNIDLILETIA